MENDIIKTEHLVYAYSENSGKTLDDVNIKVNEGEFVVILGHNGSGKSTLAKQLNALITPLEGKVYTAGMDTSDPENTLDIHRAAGMVFQNPDNQIVATVVEEDVAFGPENLGIKQEDIIEKVYFALNMVNMGDFAKRSPHMLSGGQKQRVAIAGVLAMDPKVIIFDESTSMLDPIGRKEVIETIKYLNKVEKKTVILITHFMEETEDADRVIVMTKGKVLRTGTPREIFKDGELLKKAGLIPPFATQVSNELAKAGIDIKQALNTEELANDIVEKLKGSDNNADKN